MIFNTIHLPSFLLRQPVGRGGLTRYKVKNVVEYCGFCHFLPVKHHFAYRRDWVFGRMAKHPPHIVRHCFFGARRVFTESAKQYSLLFEFGILVRLKHRQDYLTMAAACKSA